MKYTICAGNIVDGINLIGVFDSTTDAIEYASCNCKSIDWIIIPIVTVN